MAERIKKRPPCKLYVINDISDYRCNNKIIKELWEFLSAKRLLYRLDRFEGLGSKGGRLFADWMTSVGP